VQSCKTLLKFVFAVALLFASMSITPAVASSYSTDNSDLWGNEAESGWGIQFVQRAEILFATLYVYNPSGAPVWYAAVLQPTNATTWTGDLMQTSGPWFGTAPFNPAAVGVNRVGSMTFTATSDKTGVLSYSVNGTAVSKNISRTTIRYDNYTGDYAGMMSWTAEGCPNPADRGVFNNRIDFSLRHTSTSLDMASQQQGNAPICTSHGSYSQDGQFGNTTQVTNSCTNGTGAGTQITYYEMNISPGIVTMKFTAPSTNAGSKGCTLNGAMTGIRQ
jgi:hypothetical protein